MMHEPVKSDSVVVAGKPANTAEQSATEPVEPRTETKGNAGVKRHAIGTPDRHAKGTP